MERAQGGQSNAGGILKFPTSRDLAAKSTNRQVAARSAKQAWQAGTLRNGTTSVSKKSRAACLRRPGAKSAAGSPSRHRPTARIQRRASCQLAISVVCPADELSGTQTKQSAAGEAPGARGVRSSPLSEWQAGSLPYVEPGVTSKQGRSRFW